MNLGRMVLSAAVASCAMLTLGGIPEATADEPVTPGPIYNSSTSLLAKSKSISVNKESYSRIWTEEDCRALEQVDIPVVTRGGTKAARDTFNQKLQQAISSEAAAVVRDGLTYAVEAKQYGSSCGTPEDLEDYYAKISSFVTIYQNRYISATIHTFVNYNSASSCLDGYHTYTFDLKKSTWKKLADFADSNHGQLAATWLASVENTQNPSYSTYFGPLKNWTASSGGITFYAASGDIGGCADGWKQHTVAWKNILGPHDAKGPARSRTVGFGASVHLREALAKVTVTGRRVRVQVKWDDGTAVYYGVRNGARATTAWWSYPGDQEVGFASVTVHFASKKSSAKPIFVTYGS